MYQPLKRKHLPDDEWMKIIQDCRASGLSDAAWCHQNGISPSSFYTAVKRLRNKACAVPDHEIVIQSEPQEVVPVTFNESVTTYSDFRKTQESTTTSAIQIVVNDYKIQISNECEKNTIVNTLLALREIC